MPDVPRLEPAVDGGDRIWVIQDDRRIAFVRTRTIEQLQQVAGELPPLELVPLLKVR